MPEFRGVVLNDVGAAVNGATVNLYAVDTTTPSLANTTTDASGLWAISHTQAGAEAGSYDVKIANGSDVVWLRGRDRFQVSGMHLVESAANQPALTVTRSEDVASVEVAIFEGKRGTVGTSSAADDDLAYIQLRLADDAGNQDEQARLTWKATTVADGATQDGDLILSALTNNSLVDMLTLDGSASQLVPGVDFSAATIDGALTLNGTVAGTAFLDEDNMASDSATAVASQQSIKAYVDAAGVSNTTYLAKSADETISSNDVLQSDDDITFSVDANSVYVVDGALLVTTGATPDWKFQWSLPASGTIDGVYKQNNTTEMQTFNEAASSTILGAVTDFYTPFTATIITGGTAGTAVLQWAQDTSDAGNTTVSKGSWARWKKVV